MSLSEMAERWGSLSRDGPNGWPTDPIPTAQRPQFAAPRADRRTVAAILEAAADGKDEQERAQQGSVFPPTKFTIAPHAIVGDVDLDRRWE